MHALGHPFKPRDHGARPRWLRHVKNHAIEKGSSIFDALKLLPLQLLLHLREHKRNHEGLCPGNTGSGWPAERDLLPGSPEWRRRCVHLHFRGGAAGRGCLFFFFFFLNGVHSKPLRRRAGKCWCIGINCLLSWNRIEATGPDLAKKTAIVCLGVLLGLLNFTGELSTGKSQTEDYCLVSVSYWYTKVLLPVTMSQTRSDLSRRHFRSMWRHHSTRPLLCSSVSWSGTERAQCFHIPKWCNSWVLFDQTLHLGHVLFCSNGHRLATTVTVVKRRSAELKFLVPLVKCRSWWRMVPKAVWQTLEFLLERLSLTIIVVHHCTKISP